MHVSSDAQVIVVTVCFDIVPTFMLLKTKPNRKRETKRKRKKISINLFNLYYSEVADEKRKNWCFKNVSFMR